MSFTTAEAGSPAGPVTARADHGSARSGGTWLTVTRRELADLWLSGRGPVLLLAYSLLVSTTTYLVATNRALNFLEQREAVSLTLQLAIAFGGLLVLLGASDAVSGERERGTLESLLLTPAPRHGLVTGKGLAALSLWVAAWVVSTPYLVYLGVGVGVLWTALVIGLVVGGLLALGLAGFGLLVSLLSRSNRLSLTVALFSLLALYAPTQMPTSVQNGWIGEALLRVDPFTAALHYVSAVLVSGHGALVEVGWLLGPLVGAVLAWAAVWARSGRIELLPGGRA